MLQGLSRLPVKVTLNQKAEPTSNPLKEGRFAFVAICRSEPILWICAVPPTRQGNMSSERFFKSSARSGVRHVPVRNSDSAAVTGFEKTCGVLSPADRRLCHRQSLGAGHGQDFGSDCAFLVPCATDGG